MTVARKTLNFITILILLRITISILSKVTAILFKVGPEVTRPPPT